MKKTTVFAVSIVASLLGLRRDSMTIRRYIVITLVSLLAQTAMVEPCFAAPRTVEKDQLAESSWENLSRLQAGQKIEVIDSSMKMLQGAYLSHSDEAINIQHKNGPVSVPRSNVIRVSSREHSKRLRNALIGMGIGGAAGIAIGGAAGKGDPEAQAIFTAVAMPIGLGVGGGLGAVFPRFQTIYRARPEDKKKP